VESICRSKQAPFLKTFSMINGKWKLRILYELACEKILRYSELKRNLTPITHKMLSTQLKELEELADNKHLIILEAVTVHAIDNRTKLPKVYVWSKGQRSIKEPQNDK